MTGYIYDADGERVGKGAISVWSCDPSVNGFSAGTDYVRDQSGRQLSEIGPNGQGSMALVHANVYAAGALMATDDDTETHFYLTDWLGTRRVQTSYAGVVEQDCMSLPYGDSESCMPEPTENLYTGKERDTETAGGVSPFGANEGNDYFGARYYSSVMGRWMSPDWSADPTAVPYATYADPQSLNLYNYLRDNPLGGVDADGHCPVCEDVVEDIENYAASHPEAVDAALGGIARASTAVAEGTEDAVSAPLVGVVLLLTPAQTATESQDTIHEPQTSTSGNGARNGGNTPTTAVSPGPDGMKPGSSNPEGAGKPFNQATKDAARSESGNTCVFCGKSTTSEPGPDQSNIDHAIPKSRGGDNSLDNAQNTCRTCNLQKGTQTTEEYLNQQKPKNQMQ